MIEILDDCNRISNSSSLIFYPSVNSFSFISFSTCIIKGITIGGSQIFFDYPYHLIGQHDCLVINMSILPLNFTPFSGGEHHHYIEDEMIIVP